MMTGTASDIEFALDRLDGGERRVTPLVDGVSLIELVRMYETVRNFDVPGGYDGLIIDHFRFGNLAAYLGGNKAAVWPGPGQTALLGCSCGEVGCWPLFARVRQAGDYIVWDHFEQPHRKGRDYSGLEPFLFDRTRYGDALDRLDAQVAVDS